MLYDLKKLETTFETLANASHEGIEGILKFEGNAPGPCLGITVCTHGNEPSGLAAVAFLIDHLEKFPLLGGSLYLILNNIKATRMYFAAKTEEDKRKARYVDINMNRLPKNVLELTNDNRYEVMRVQTLNPIWETFTLGLDIHSMTSSAEPMLITKGQKFDATAKLIRGFPIDILISNIDQIQLNLPAFAFYGGIKKEIPVFAIETGQHTDPVAFDRAIAVSKALLQNAGMLPSTPDITNKSYKEYRIDDSIIFPDASFDFIKDFKSYDVVQEGEVLARDNNGSVIRAPFDGCLLFPTERRGKDKDISEEVAFVSRPMMIRDLS
jgi:uncharacterized protein